MHGEAQPKGWHYSFVKTLQHE